ncbi:hypothetical protein FF011L_14600 [Roseimaritima multifibrata]|uniref:Uncharacterized protein n=1 Tax=Roseimaritima multifibrata TaxID=1930274 RepID=A0A517MCV2_9BACT|nr:hypothetical protein FF011L_14600 [Roseimaritima multifibrata]
MKIIPYRRAGQVLAGAGGCEAGSGARGIAKVEVENGKCRMAVAADDFSFFIL